MVAPLHAARTAQRAIPTVLNTQECLPCIGSQNFEMLSVQEWRKVIRLAGRAGDIVQIPTNINPLCAR
jgi:hypothetical protein